MSGVQENGSTSPLNLAALVEISRGDTAVERRLLGVFRAATAADGGALRLAVQARNLSGVERAAHRLCGASKMAGALRLAALSDDLVQRGSAADWSAIALSADALFAEIARIDDYLAMTLDGRS